MEGVSLRWFQRAADAVSFLPAGVRAVPARPPRCWGGECGSTDLAPKFKFCGRAKKWGRAYRTGRASKICHPPGLLLAALPLVASSTAGSRAGQCMESDSTASSERLGSGEAKQQPKRPLRSRLVDIYKGAP